MSSLIQGRIVYAKIPIPDPQGRNPKANRPFVVITSNSDLKKNPATVQGIGVSDELSGTPEDEYCLLPTGSGRFKHGCSDGSAACCQWIEDLNVEDLEWRNGFVVAKVLFAIIEKAKKLRPDVFPSSPDEPKVWVGAKSRGEDRRQGRIRQSRNKLSRAT